MNGKSWTIVVEQAAGNYSAYSPDIPGCVATGATVEETMQNMIDAMRFHTAPDMWRGLEQK